MTKFIVGNNAAGKTLFLKERINNIIRNYNVISNCTETLIDRTKVLDTNVAFCEYVCDAFEADEYTLFKDEFVLSGNRPECSSDIWKLLFLLSRDAKYMYLDEPEFGLTQDELKYIVCALNYLCKTLDEVYIVTYCEDIIMSVHEALFFCIDNGKLKQVSREYAYECVDKI